MFTLGNWIVDKAAIRARRMLKQPTITFRVDSSCVSANSMNATKHYYIIADVAYECICNLTICTYTIGTKRAEQNKRARAKKAAKRVATHAATCAQ
jgi:hypothetical protein